MLDQRPRIAAPFRQGGGAGRQVGEMNMAHNEQTSPWMASLASEVLRDPLSPPAARSLAACVLTQAPDRQPPQNAMQGYALFETPRGNKMRGLLKFADF